MEPPNLATPPPQSPLHRHADHSTAIAAVFPASAPPQDIESALSSAGIPIPPPIAVVDQVLETYRHLPTFALRFFRWAATHLNPPATTWNLLVDVLGENHLFVPMWDAIRSMKEHQLLSPETFYSVFSSYCSANRIDEATMAFDVMEKFGLSQDVSAVNSLLGAICSRDDGSEKGLEFLEKVKGKIGLNGDSYAVLLQGFEREGNVGKAMTMFGDWGHGGSCGLAYDALLTILVRRSRVGDAFKILNVMKGHDCVPSLKFFSDALDVLVKQNDSAYAVPLWEMMVGSGVLPTLSMYNTMISLLCKSKNVEEAYRLLDEMPFNGIFPDSVTYNVIFQCMVENKMVREAGKFFVEMVKNEWPPTHSNCAAAIAMLLGGNDPEMAIEIWTFEVDNGIEPIDESANALLLGFCDLGRVLELRKFVEDMFDRRINVHESTMTKLKNTFYKKGKKARDTYDSLSKRWKAC